MNKQAEVQDESVSSNIKKICYERGIFRADGMLDPQGLYQAFKDGLLDVEDFKSALKWIRTNVVVAKTSRL